MIKWPRTLNKDAPSCQDRDGAGVDEGNRTDVPFVAAFGVEKTQCEVECEPEKTTRHQRT